MEALINAMNKANAAMRESEAPPPGHAGSHRDHDGGGDSHNQPAGQETSHGPIVARQVLLLGKT